MILKLQGTREGEEVHLVSVRKPEGALKPGEYAYQKDTASPITSFRKKVTSEVKDFQLNSIVVRVGEYENKPTRTYSLRVTYKGEFNHLIDLGGGMVAKSVVNSFLSLYAKETLVDGKAKFELSNLTPEQVSASDLAVSFYMNKDGYASATVRKHGELLSWCMDYATQQSYVDSKPDPFDEKVTLKSYKRLDARIEELVAELNKILPAGNFAGGNAFDDDEQSTQNTTNGSIPFGDDETPTVSDEDLA